MPDIVQVIKYEGDNQTFIWKHPREDFNLGSQLIVHESQEAIFFMNGQALDLFGPGRYTLSTQNIPLIGGVVKLVTDGESPFHCEVYFINKTEQIGIKWGTDSQVNYLDPNFNNYPFSVGASGEMNLRVADSRKLLLKVVGTASQLSQSEMASILRGPMMAKIKSYLPAVLSERKIPIFDIDQHMEEFSKDLQQRLLAECNDYGVEMVKFWINSFVKPESDPIYIKLKSLRGRGLTDVQEAMLQQQLDIIHQQTKTQKSIMEAEARAKGRQVEGYTYQLERAYDVAERLAQNEGVGNMSSLGAGIGMLGGMAGGVGSVVAGLTTDALRPLTDQAMGSSATQTQFDSDMPPMLDLKEGTIQQPSVNNPTTSPAGCQNDIQTRIKNLEMMKPLISEADYNAKLKEILDSI